MIPLVKKNDTSSEYYFEEGCFITELSNSENDPELSIAQARVEPGKKTRWHCLDGISERYLILNGQGIVEIGNLKPQIVNVGDVVYIPAQERQRITNQGTSSLIFLAICSPAFRQEVYRDLEQ